MPNHKQPWIYKPLSDGLLILAPPFVIVGAIFLFPAFFNNYQQDIPSWMWIALVVGIDVSHVYATLYRTYFDQNSFDKHKNLYILTPLFCLLVALVLYSIDGMLFWRVMAYLAVFHFVRQQYGIFKLYTRFESPSSWEKNIDSIAIYASTVIPILIWHFSDHKEFYWFIKDDFMLFPSTWAVMTLDILLACILLAYVIYEVKSSILSSQVNWPKNILLIGTLLSWYYGIVINDGDLVFTSLNIISHGIPYMALTWMYGKKRQSNHSEGILRWVFGPSSVGWVIFIGLLLTLALSEELLWDVFIWRDHPEYFHTFYFPMASWWKKLEVLLIPLLSLPQITHYILDGFIWKKSFESGHGTNVLPTY